MQAKIQQAVVEAVGWRKAAMYLCALYVPLLVACAMLYRPPPSQAKGSASVKPNTSLEVKAKVGLWGTCCQTLGAIFPPHVLRDPVAWSIGVSYFVTCLGFTSPHIFLADSATEQGVSKSDAVTCIAILGVIR